MMQRWVRIALIVIGGVLLGTMPGRAATDLGQHCFEFATYSDELRLGVVQLDGPTLLLVLGLRWQSGELEAINSWGVAP